MMDGNGNLLGEWGGFGVGRGNMTGPWGIASSSDGVWAADWFGCTVQKFRVDGYEGQWERTLWSPLRSDAQTIKCENESAGARKLYQRVSIPDDECYYRVEFLAFTDGNGPEDQPPVNDLSAYVSPYAYRPPGQGDPPGDNEVIPPSIEYHPYLVTTVTVPGKKNRYAWFVRGQFQVGPDQDGDWYVGVQVEAGKLACVGSLACFREPGQ